MIQPEVLVAGPFKEGDIDIKFTTESNLMSSPELEEKIAKLWEEKYTEAKQLGKHVYNGQSYRLDSFENNAKLKLTISLFSYSTRYPLTLLFKEGKVNLPASYYPNGLAIGGLVETADNKFVFGKRGGRSMTHTSIDFIGGIVEDVELKGSRDLFVLNEAELLEEVGVSKGQIIDMVILGLVQSNTGNVIIISQTRLNISSVKLQEQFRSNSDDEMDELVFIDKSELEEYLLGLGGYKQAVVTLLDELKFWK